MVRPIIPADSADDWGVIPTVDGDATAPATDTQTVQSENAATQAVAQAVFLPPAPTWSPLLDVAGNMTAPWITWFQTLNRKLGGYASTPFDDSVVLEPEQSSQPDSRVGEIINALALEYQDKTGSQQVVKLTDLWGDQSDPNPDRGRWNDLRMIGSARVIGAGSASLGVFRGNLRAWEFVNTSTNEFFLQGQLPHSYLEGTDIKLHLHWGHTSAVDNGAIVWQVGWAWTNVGDAMAVPTTTTCTAANVLGADQYKQLIQPVVTMTGTGKRISSILTLRVFRDPSDPNDTSTASGFLFEVDAHHRVDHDGSLGEFTKY